MIFEYRLPRGIKGKAVRNGYGPAAVIGTKVAKATVNMMGRHDE